MRERGIAIFKELLIPRSTNFQVFHTDSSPRTSLTHQTPKIKFKKKKSIKRCRELCFFSKNLAFPSHTPSSHVVIIRTVVDANLKVFLKSLKLCHIHWWHRSPKPPFSHIVKSLVFVHAIQSISCLCCLNCYT